MKKSVLIKCAVGISILAVLFLLSQAAKAQIYEGEYNGTISGSIEKKAIDPTDETQRDWTWTLKKIVFSISTTQGLKMYGKIAGESFYHRAPSEKSDWSNQISGCRTDLVSSSTLSHVKSLNFTCVSEVLDPIILKGTISNGSISGTWQKKEQPFVSIGKFEATISSQPKISITEGTETQGKETKEKKVPEIGKSIRNSLGMIFMGIPAGSFTMGSPLSEKDRDADEVQHQVRLTKGFWMSKYEITQIQWGAVMGNIPGNSEFCPRCPVEQVSWDDVQVFIRKLNEKGLGKYRLPTEAEWEYAARAGSTTPFYWGDQYKDACQYANLYDKTSDEKSEHPSDSRLIPFLNCQDGYAEIATVGEFLPNAFGLHDMSGNVSEWVADWQGDYPIGSVIDPKGPESGLKRVIRGGDWGHTVKASRSANRIGNTPSTIGRDLGFRLVMDE